MSLLWLRPFVCVGNLKGWFEDSESIVAGGTEIKE